MGTLTMAIATLDGVVLAADSAYENQEDENPNIVQVGDSYGALIEPDLESGRRIVDETLESAPEAGYGSLEAVVEEAQTQGHALVEEDSELRPTGVIFCGLDHEPDTASFPQILGIHSARGFDATPFTSRAFGGSLHSIARYLGDRIVRQRPTTDVAEHFAAFAVLASYGALGPGRMEPYLSIARITASDGFEWVSAERLEGIVTGANDALLRVPLELSELFLGQAEDGDAGVYRLEQR